MFQSDSESCEQEIVPVKMSCNSHIPTAKTSLLEEVEEHESISQEIHVPFDGDEYDFRFIPPSPNNPEASMSEKQDAPREQEQFMEGGIDKFEELVELCIRYGSAGQAEPQVVGTGAGGETLSDPPPYTSL